jgi:hypothetical protein
MSDLVALKNNRGADEANVHCVSYPRQPDGTFLMPEDVALQLLGVPAGFYRATADDHPLETTMTRDFLALDANGNPQPGAQFEVGVGGRYVADDFGIVSGVAPNHAVNMIASGAVPLLPPSWIDPRPVGGTVK